MKFNNYPIKYLILSIILTILASTGCQETKTGPNFIRGNPPNVVIPKTAAALKTTAPRALTRVQQVHNERRIALVIGNNNYQHTYQLYNAVADAQAFHQELKRRGFEVVYRENATRRIMNHAVDEFLAKLSSGSIGLIYYSGHGVQIDSSNYLLPTDIKAETSNDVMHDGISLNKLIDRASNMQTKFMLAIIDACRNNPFALANTPTLRSIGTTKGLAPPLGNATGVMIVYSAGANQTALDKLGRNDNHPNGLFAREFLKAMRIPGLTVLEVVDKVKKSVYTKAKQVAHVQTPAVYDQSMGTFYFSRISKEDLAFKKRGQVAYQGLAATSLAQSDKAANAIKFTGQKSAVLAELGRFAKRSGNARQANRYFAKSLQLAKSLTKTNRDFALALLAANHAQAQNFKKAKQILSQVKDASIRHLVTLNTNNWQQTANIGL